MSTQKQVCVTMVMWSNRARTLVARTHVVWDFSSAFLLHHRISQTQPKWSLEPSLKFPVTWPVLFQIFKAQKWNTHSLFDVCPDLPRYMASIFKKTGQVCWGALDGLWWRAKRLNIYLPKGSDFRYWLNNEIPELESWWRGFALWKIHSLPPGKSCQAGGGICVNRSRYWFPINRDTVHRTLGTQP